MYEHFFYIFMRPEMDFIKNVIDDVVEWDSVYVAYLFTYSNTTTFN